MDILFIHGNYPGQFRNLAMMLGKDDKHRVVFLTAKKVASEEALPGVEIYTYNGHREPSEQTHHYLHATEEAVLQGQAVVRRLADLLETGLRPRIVVTHAGMGIGLFIKKILPKAMHVGYFEWYFRSETTKHLLRDYDLDAQLRTGLRNLPILQELERCDMAVIPTRWQKDQFPEAYKEKLEVIFDGVDTGFFL